MPESEHVEDVDTPPFPGVPRASPQNSETPPATDSAGDGVIEEIADPDGAGPPVPGEPPPEGTPPSHEETPPPPVEIPLPPVETTTTSKRRYPVRIRRRYIPF